MRIWKWTLTISDRQTLHLPKDAKILSVQPQNDCPQLWALCDEYAENTPRTFAMYGTGHIVPGEHGTFIGTFQLRDGHLVFHLFEV